MLKNKEVVNLGKIELSICYSHIESMMPRIRESISRFAGAVTRSAKRVQVEQKQLGRWTIHHDDRAFAKADQTNEDHCGVCTDKLEQYRRQRELEDEKNVVGERQPRNNV